MFTHQRISQAVVILTIAGILRIAVALVAQAVIAAKFGTSVSVDAYLISLTIPNILGDYFIGGIILLAFIPVFIEYKKKEGEVGAWQITNTLINGGAAILFLGTVFYCLFAPFLIHILAPGFSEETKHLAIGLMRFTSPLLFFFGLVVIFGGILQSYKHFITPSLAPLAFNLFIIVGAFLFSIRLGIYGLALGAILGGFSYLIIQVSTLIGGKRKFYNFRFFWNHPGVRKVCELALPIFGVSLTYNLINVLIRFFASTLGEGSIASLNYAYQIVKFPIAIIAASVGIAIYPAFSQEAAKGDLKELIKIFSLSVRFILFITIPITVGLVLLRVPLVKLLFERGLFGKEATLLTAEALFYYSFGLFAMAGNIIVIRIFYSLQDMVTPLKVGVSGLIVNIFLSLILIKYLNLGGLVLAFSAYSIFIFILLLIFLKKKFSDINEKSIFITCLKTVSASSIMGFGIYFICKYVNFWLAVIAGPAIFLLVSITLRIKELEEIKDFGKGMFLKTQPMSR